MLLRCYLFSNICRFKLNSYESFGQCPTRQYIVSYTMNRVVGLIWEKHPDPYPVSFSLIRNTKVYTDLVNNRVGLIMRVTSFFSLNLGPLEPITYIRKISP